MYEDSAIELRAFPARSRVFCIASAGDMALELAGSHTVTAVDINPLQLAYARARLTGAPAERGTAERLLDLGRTLLPLLGWRRSVLEAFLQMKDPAEQLDFWRRHLDTRRFRAGVDLLLSLTALRSAYAAPFLAVLPPRFGQVMRARMERCFGRHPNATNPFARALLRGAFPTSGSGTQGEVDLACADAAQFLERCPPASFDAFTLSNILDGAEPSYRERLLTAVQRAATPGALVVHRSFGEPTSEMATNVAADDRSMLWGIVDVRRVDQHTGHRPGTDDENVTAHRE
jgi:S-adenosylmethionine:diacylglycerol 3-amino-3-carboxypropyl transferase